MSSDLIIYVKSIKVFVVLKSTKFRIVTITGKGQKDTGKEKGTQGDSIISIILYFLTKTKQYKNMAES